MKKNKKKAFTLVELLAVIVILAIILVIAIPQITNTIKASRLGAIESSAKLIASNAEDYYLAQQTINPDYSASSVDCTVVAKLSDDYDLENCSVTYNNGKATVVLKGSQGKKFDGITCSGTKDRIECGYELANSESNDPYIYSVSSTAFKIGEPIPEGVYTYNSVEKAFSETGYSVATAHKVENDIITESYLVFKFNNKIYYVRGGVDEQYSETKPVHDSNYAVATALVSDLENSGFEFTALGHYEVLWYICFERDEYYCIDSQDFDLQYNDDGTIFIYDGIRTAIIFKPSVSGESYVRDGYWGN